MPASDHPAAVPEKRTAPDIPRGAVKAFRELLNRRNQPAHESKTSGALVDTRYRNGRYRQLKRPYGDYLYAQDREKFLVNLREWIDEGMPQ